MGRVIDAGSNKPIQGAMVAINIQGAPPVAGPVGMSATPSFKPQAVVTGSDGMFVFTALPKSTFMLVGSAVGFNGFGGETPQSTQTLTLADGEKLNDVEVRLARPGALTGQVRDERGDGVEGITMSLLRMTTSGGRRMLALARTATTDDRGAYRFANLRAGDYGVCALFSRHIAPVAAGVAQATGNGDQQRTISGSGGMSPSGSGYRVGDLVLISASASRNVDPAPDESGRLSVFADACYPSAANVQGLEIVHIESGQDRGQLDMVLRIVPSVRITGTITGPANRLSGMAVHLYPAAPGDLTMSMAMEAAQTITDPSGGFGFIGVPQGSYVLRAFYVGDRNTAADYYFQLASEGYPVPIAAPPPPTGPIEPTLWAALPITIGDTDMTGLTLALREGPRITGTIVFDGGSPRPQAARFTASTINFEPTENSTSLGIARGRVAAEGTFSVPGVVPGRYFVRPSLSFPGWSLKSATANGRDVLDEPIDIDVNDVNGIVITLTDRPNELAGTVRGASGQADGNARVLVFPSDRARWSVVTAGRRMVSSVVSRQGTYSLSGLPAGDYFMAAVSDQFDPNWQNPKVLDALSHVAVLVSLRDGDHRTVDLTTSVIK